MNWLPTTENKLAAAGEEEEGGEWSGMGGAREDKKNVGWQINGTHLNKECPNLTSNLLKKRRTKALRD
jgi:hypothetical protein